MGRVNILLLGQGPNAEAAVAAIKSLGLHADSALVYLPAVDVPGYVRNVENKALVDGMAALPQTDQGTIVLDLDGPLPTQPGWDYDLQVFYHDSVKLYGTTTREPAGEIFGPIIFPAFALQHCPVLASLARAKEHWRKELRYEVGTADSVDITPKVEGWQPYAPPAPAPVTDEVPTDTAAEDVAPAPEVPAATVVTAVPVEQPAAPATEWETNGARPRRQRK